MSRYWLSIFGGLALITSSQAAELTVDHGRFQKVRLLVPEQAAERVVIWLGTASGWTDADTIGTRQLAKAGALVLGVDGAALRAIFNTDEGGCAYPAGDLENLSRFAQAYTHQPATRLPVLTGEPTLTYAVLAQSPPGHFAGGAIEGFSFQLQGFANPFCTGDGLSLRQAPASGQHQQFFAADPKLANALVVFGAGADAPALARLPAVRTAPIAGSRALRATALQAALATLSDRAAPLATVAPADLAGLPVIENRASGTDPHLVVFWSGDGGWATIDKEVSEALQKKGVSVVGVDSLRYFWSARSPESVARDNAAIARHYLAAWGKSKLVLVGFSQGADVLPFAITRMPSALRSQLLLFAALGLSDHAVFEFQLSNWVADNDNGPATAPEMAKLGTLPVLCLYGKEDTDSVCSQLKPGATLTITGLPGDHHFDGAYEKLATLILAALARPN
jgi:type IV secretory pathway VirJ component